MLRAHFLGSNGQFVRPRGKYHRIARRAFSVLELIQGTSSIGPRRWWSGLRNGKCQWRCYRRPLHRRLESKWMKFLVEVYREGEGWIVVLPRLSVATHFTLIIIILHTLYPRHVLSKKKKKLERVEERFYSHRAFLETKWYHNLVKASWRGGERILGHEVPIVSSRSAVLAAITIFWQHPCHLPT